MGVEIIAVSAKGQIVLPKEMRKALSISDGGALAAIATDKVIVLKPIELPTTKEFSKWLKEAQAWAKKAGYEEDDVTSIVQSVRNAKRRKKKQ